MAKGRCRASVIAASRTEVCQAFRCGSAGHEMMLSVLSRSIWRGRHEADNTFGAFFGRQKLNSSHARKLHAPFQYVAASFTRHSNAQRSP